MVVDNLSEIYTSIKSIDGRIRLDYILGDKFIYLSFYSLQANNIDIANDTIIFSEIIPNFYPSDTVINDGTSSGIFYSYIERYNQNTIKFKNNYMSSSKKTIRSNYIPFRRGM